MVMLLIIRMILILLISLLGLSIQTDENPSVDWMTDEKQPNFQKQFQNQTLIFTTPWNKDGDIYVEKYISKIDFYSPCIFDIVMKGNKAIIQNENNYFDKKELFESLKLKNPNLKIVPRLYIAGDKLDVIKGVGGNQGIYNAFIDMLVKMAHEKYIDGFVWDSPYNLFVKNNKYAQVALLMKQIINNLKQRIGKKIIFINIPNPQQNQMNFQQIKSLKMDGLLIQNYYQDGYLDSIRRTQQFIGKAKLKNKKIFFVIPFFSRKNQKDLVSSSQVKKSVHENGYFKAQYKSICRIDTGGNKYQTPCPQYFKQAFKLIHPYNLGIWEGGNGLQQYYSLL